MGSDGRVFPVGTKPSDATTKKGATASMFAGDGFPIQVKQADKVGRPDIDPFGAVMAREERQRGFVVAFGYSSDAEAECAVFHQETGRIIKLFTVQEILDERQRRNRAARDVDEKPRRTEEELPRMDAALPRMDEKLPRRDAARRRRDEKLPRRDGKLRRMDAKLSRMDAKLRRRDAKARRMDAKARRGDVQRRCGDTAGLIMGGAGVVG